MFFLIIEIYRVSLRIAVRRGIFRRIAARGRDDHKALGAAGKRVIRDALYARRDFCSFQTDTVCKRTHTDVFAAVCDNNSASSNADERLCEYGREVGLLDDARWEHYLLKHNAVEKEIKRVNSTHFSPSDKLNELLVRNGTTPVSTGVGLGDLLRRPQLTYDALTEIDTMRPELSREVIEAAETRIKYDGYVKRQMGDAKRLAKSSEIRIPEDFDYNALDGLRLEARQKLDKIRPLNLGQASRISGVSPADVTALMIYLER